MRRDLFQNGIVNCNFHNLSRLKKLLQNLFIFMLPTPFVSFQDRVSVVQELLDRNSDLCPEQCACRGGIFIIPFENIVGMTESGVSEKHCPYFKYFWVKPDKKIHWLYPLIHIFLEEIRARTPFRFSFYSRLLLPLSAEHPSRIRTSSIPALSTSEIAHVPNEVHTLLSMLDRKKTGGR
jgi:hypothetical protein